MLETGRKRKHPKMDLSKMEERPVSGHLWYEYPREEDIEGFQVELTVPTGKDIPNTYCAAIGWHRGYFGMQVNSCKSERRIIFSVWDDGADGVVDTIDAHPHALVEEFGGEGEGMHTVLWHGWETNVPQLFRVFAKPDSDTTTIYSGYFLLRGKWTLIGSYRAPSDGKFLTGLYSFLENFGCDGTAERECLYGKQAYRIRNSTEWTPLRKIKCGISKRPEGDFYAFGVEGETFQVKINGTENFGRECTLPDCLER